MVLKLPQGHEGSEYVFRFEIGQREGGFFSARTDTQNHPVSHSNIDDIIFISECKQNDKQIVFVIFVNI